MATVRITGNWPHFLKKEWVGSPPIDADGRIERSVQMPEEAYQAIERQIAGGAPEGLAVIPGGIRFEWFLDGALPHESRTARSPGGAGGMDRLRPLLPEIARLARGDLDGSDRQADVIRLLASVMAKVLRTPANLARV